MRGYRAWIKDENWMGFVTLLSLANQYAEVVTDFDPSASCVGNTRNFDFKEIVLMQETGIKDIKDIMIWEGDIIGNPLRHARHIIFYSEEEAGFVSEYIQYDEYNRYCGLRKEWIATCEKEVLGNKYENPALLEVEK